MTRSPGPIRQLWYNWKMKRYPWRRKWLVGFDLEGNTFWEFKDALNSNRTRRMVQYSRYIHHGDVNVSPGWVQWLRHTRFEAPTIAEQQADVMRQDRIKTLAAQADARWAAKPSALDSPDKQQPAHMLESRDIGAIVQETGSKRETGASSGRGPEESGEAVAMEEIQPSGASKKMKAKKQPKESPFKTAVPSNPGDDWQPESWTPSPAKRRR